MSEADKEYIRRVSQMPVISSTEKTTLETKKAQLIKHVEKVS